MQSTQHLLKMQICGAAASAVARTSNNSRVDEELVHNFVASSIPSDAILSLEDKLSRSLLRASYLRKLSFYWSTPFNRATESVTIQNLEKIYLELFTATFPFIRFFVERKNTL